MARTTYEEAKCCPKCGVPGNKVKVEHIANGARVETLHCVTENCRWFNTGWAVQINKDGSIPELNRNDQKQFQIPSWLENAGRREVEETSYIFGLDKDPDDPEYGVQRDINEIKRQF